MGLYLIQKLLHSKGNDYQGEETAYRMGKKSMPAIHWIKD
jgi:hypothetical protein